MKGNAEEEKIERIELPYAAAQEHRELLARMATSPAKLQMSWALLRYLRWLELSSTEVVLPMTPEIEFARHTHRLAPVDFAKRGRPELDGVALCSMVDAEQMWQQRWREPYQLEKPSRGQLRAARRSVASAWKKLHLSMKAQRAFAAKMTEPLTKVTEKVWPQMLEHYSKFFALFPKAPPVGLVPTMMVDFCWHTHMRLHEQYVSDSRRCFDKIIDHDDSIAPSHLARKAM